MRSIGPGRMVGVEGGQHVHVGEHAQSRATLHCAALLLFSAVFTVHSVCAHGVWHRVRACCLALSVHDSVSFSDRER